MRPETQNQINRIDLASRHEQVASLETVQSHRAIRYPDAGGKIYEIIRAAEGAGIYVCNELDLLGKEWKDTTGEDKFTGGAVDIINILRSENYVLAELSSVNADWIGKEITIADVDDPTFDGVFVITNVLEDEDGDFILYNQTGDDAIGSGGTATINNQTEIEILNFFESHPSENQHNLSVRDRLVAWEKKDVGETVDIIYILRSGNWVIAKLSSVNAEWLGEEITITGVNNLTFYGVFVITNVLENENGKFVKYYQTGGDASGSGGTAKIYYKHRWVGIPFFEDKGIRSAEIQSVGAVSFTCKLQRWDGEGWITFGRNITVLPMLKIGHNDLDGFVWPLFAAGDPVSVHQEQDGSWIIPGLVVDDTEVCE
ncbi:MAG: hypothetical protein ABSH16_04965 [Sedimentisphaerales bacterium]